MRNADPATYIRRNELVKTLGLTAIAAVAALILGFGSQIGSATPKAHADTTGVTVIGCEFIAGAVDGVTTDATTAADVVAACGIGGAVLPPTAAVDTASIENLAKAIGDKDGVLEKSDFSGALAESWDDNQISTVCTAAGLYCTLDVFVFVDDEKPVDIDLPSGLATVENASLDFTCNADGVTLTTDNDCSDTVPNNGDGVVLFHIVDGTAVAGDVKSVIVRQETVEQPFDVNVVGTANDIKLTLVEKNIETNASAANVTACVANADVTDGIDAPTTTLAYAQVFDADNTVLTRVPVAFSITPSSAADIASLGVGTPGGVTGNTLLSLDPTTAGAPTAAYVVICGGKSTGTATVNANLVALGHPTIAADDTSTADVTVTGAPSAAALTAVAASIKCDGSETSTVTAKVTDSAGNNVADGVPVNFSVVALGTANPINTTTTGGVATTTITPLSNSSAGVTVIVTAGDSDIKSPIQTSVRVDCALPLVTQPTAAPPVTVPTTRPGVTGPDTGNGGYLGQSDSTALPMWTFVVLAMGSVVLVAGGAAARRAGK